MLNIGQQVQDLARLSDLLDDVVDVAYRIDEIMGMAEQLLREGAATSETMLQRLTWAERSLNIQTQGVEIGTLALLKQASQLGYRDQRLLQAMLAINFELERMADYLKTIGQMSRAIKRLPSHFTQPLLLQMLQTSRSMLKAVITDLQQGNGEAVTQIAGSVAMLSEYYEQLDSQLNPLDRYSDEEGQIATLLLIIAAKIERVGNRVLNIAERGLYVET